MILRTDVSDNTDSYALTTNTDDMNCLVLVHLFLAEFRFISVLQQSYYTFSRNNFVQIYLISWRRRICQSVSDLASLNCVFPRGKCTSLSYLFSTVAPASRSLMVCLPPEYNVAVVKEPCSRRQMINDVIDDDNQRRHGTTQTGSHGLRLRMRPELCPSNQFERIACTSATED